MGESDEKKGNKTHEPHPEYAPEHADETTDALDIESAATQKVTQLKKKLKTCEEERRRYLEDLQRAKADYLNSKRRLEEESKRSVANAVDDCLASILSVYDSFQAMKQSGQWERVDSTWQKGIEHIEAQLFGVLRAHGVTKLEAEGAPFDPNCHEAVETVQVEDAAEHDTVTEVVQDGFVRQDEAGNQRTLLRAAKVKVGANAAGAA